MFLLKLEKIRTTFKIFTHGPTLIITFRQSQWKVLREELLLELLLFKRSYCLFCILDSNPENFILINDWISSLNFNHNIEIWRYIWFLITSQQSLESKIFYKWLQHFTTNTLCVTSCALILDLGFLVNFLSLMLWF